jgi:putative FmdB family regulatory protein
MPIYAYKCSSCGHAQDVLQKISDAPLTHCSACGAATFAKQVTAAGFQLKGSGWYATDFRNNGTAAAKKPDADAKGDGAAAADVKPADAKPAEAKGAETKSVPAAGAAPAAAPAGGAAAGT